MTERIDTEVAIIGGGIVGGSAALFLRRLGVPVLLLEAVYCFIFLYLIFAGAGPLSLDAILRKKS